MAAQARSTASGPWPRGFGRPAAANRVGVRRDAGPETRRCRRFWSLDGVTCENALATLVNARFLSIPSKVFSSCLSVGLTRAEGSRHSESCGRWDIVVSSISQKAAHKESVSTARVIFSTTSVKCSPRA